MAAERDEALDEARAIFTRQTPRISRKRAAHQLRELGCTLDQIGAVFHVSKERIRQDLLWDPRYGRPPENFLKYLSRASAPEAERTGPGRRAGSAQLPWRLRQGCPGWS
jgi:hypothetical protein